MPIIEVKAFDRRFEDADAASRLIARLTDAVGEIYGPELAEETWVILEGVSPKLWGLGGAVRG